MTYINHKCNCICIKQQITVLFCFVFPGVLPVPDKCDCDNGGDSGGIIAGFTAALAIALIVVIISVVLNVILLRRKTRLGLNAYFVSIIFLKSTLFQLLNLKYFEVDKNITIKRQVC